MYGLLSTSDQSLFSCMFFVAGACLSLSRFLHITLRSIQTTCITFVSVSPQVEAIEKRCLELFARDYKYSIIHNSNGEVCGHYPRQIVFLEYECTDVERDRYLSTTRSIHYFLIQSPMHSVTNYPLVCLCHSSNHAHLTVEHGAKVSLHLQPL